MPGVLHVAVVGLMARHDESSYGTSLDLIAALDLSDVPGSESWRIDKKIVDDGKALALATVGIRARV